MVDTLAAAGIWALAVLALPLGFYPWHDPRKRQRARLAAPVVAWGAFLGLFAVYFHYRHSLPPPWQMLTSGSFAAAVTIRRKK
jgi:type VI protein secretion system component VasF